MRKSSGKKRNSSSLRDDLEQDAVDIRYGALEIATVYTSDGGGDNKSEGEWKKMAVATKRSVGGEGVEEETWRGEHRSLVITKKEEKLPYPCKFVQLCSNIMKTDNKSDAILVLWLNHKGSHGSSTCTPGSDDGQAIW